MENRPATADRARVWAQLAAALACVAVVLAGIALYRIRNLDDELYKDAVARITRTHAALGTATSYVQMGASAGERDGFLSVSCQDSKAQFGLSVNVENNEPEIWLFRTSRDGTVSDGVRIPSEALMRAALKIGTSIPRPTVPSPSAVDKP